MRSMSLVATPPRVSMPRESGVTSSSRTSLTSPDRTAAWMAAPMATHSIGSTPRWIFLPTMLSTNFCTIGMRVGPPTRMTESILSGVSLASFRAFVIGPRQRLHDGVDELLQLGPADGHGQVLRPGGVGGDERQVDLGGHGGRELDLGLLAGLADALHGHLVRGEVDAGLLAGTGWTTNVHQDLVHVRAAQLRVAAGGDDLEDALR